MFSPFSSKYDHYLAGTVALTAAEQRGLEIFEDPARGNCAACHPSRPGADGAPPMFTNYGYANLGVPRYDNNLFYVQPATFNPDGAAYVDRGLGRTTDDPPQDGKFRTPTLRNIARTAPYGHNGYFNNLPLLHRLPEHARRRLGARSARAAGRRRRRTRPVRGPRPSSPRRSIATSATCTSRSTTSTTWSRSSARSDRRSSVALAPEQIDAVEVAVAGGGLELEPAREPVLERALRRVLVGPRRQVLGEREEQRVGQPAAHGDSRRWTSRWRPRT